MDGQGSGRCRHFAEAEARCRDAAEQILLVVDNRSRLVLCGSNCHHEWDEVILFWVSRASRRRALPVDQALGPLLGGAATTVL